MSRLRRAGGWTYTSGDVAAFLIGIRQRVYNVRDEEATTLLIAHVEYWKKPLLVKTIYDEIGAL
ncbi:MAG: hypothetical protein WD802_00390 [Gemmatimonadaceae bacterium]